MFWFFGGTADIFAESAIMPKQAVVFALFPQCVPTIPDTDPTYATVMNNCLNTAFNAIDINCQVAGSSTNTGNSGNTQSGQTSTIVYPTVDSAGNQIHCPVTFYSGGA